MPRRKPRQSRARAADLGEVEPFADRIRICQVPRKVGPPLDQPHKVCELLRAEATADRESLYAIHLNAQNRVLGKEEISRGALSSVETTGREIFKGAMLSNARAIILAHNHPSGDPTPSEADKQMTKWAKETGKLLGIDVLDHVIVASGGCRSLEYGVLEDNKRGKK